MCPKKIYDTEDRHLNDTFTDPAGFRDYFTIPVSKSLYNDFLKRSGLTGNPAHLSPEFEDL
jgi:hypothetical protein